MDAPDSRAVFLERLADPPYRSAGPVLVLKGVPSDMQHRYAKGWRWAGPHVHVAAGHNTYEEAVDCVSRFPKDLDLQLITSKPHLPRALLTFVRVLEDRGLDRRVRVWPVGVPSDTDTIGIETERIAAYQAKGHVASYEAGIAYVDWLETQ